MRRVIYLFVAGLVGLALDTARGANTNVFELKDGDRVLLVGDSLMEREQRYGHLEYALTTRFPDRNMIFRSFGWSADYPSRPAALFNWNKPPEAWLNHLFGQIRAVQPTVVCVGYGMSPSFAGKTGLEDFKQWMTRLLDAIRATNSQVRFVLFSPIRHENRPPPAPASAAHNEQLGLYAQALRDLAGRYDAHYVSFYDLLSNEYFLAVSPMLTENGTELNEYGSRRAAEVLAQQLGWYPPTWRVGITEEGRPREGGYGAKVLELDRKEDRVRLVILEELLVPPPLPDLTNSAPFATPDCRIQFQDMKPGLYQLKIDGQNVQTSDSKLLGKMGVRVKTGPQFAQAQELLQAIRKKNQLFAELWRSQTSTNLLQPDTNQAAPAQTTPKLSVSNESINAEESKIARLKKPVSHVYELVLVPGAQPPAAEPNPDGK